MQYTERFKKVAVLGAGGKMGSGILLLTAMEMFRLSSLDPEGPHSYQLLAIDVSEQNLRGIMDYLRAQLTKVAEKKIVKLREDYSKRSDLIENGEIIEQYVRDVMKLVTTSTSLEQARNSGLIFEAVSENPDLKVKLIKTIEGDEGSDSWYLTNTSSIPISLLDQKAGLQGRIIGFHFYNPPAVQKLVELIVSQNTLSELTNFSLEFAKGMKKKLVRSNDIAGFIGNGHFMRDILYGVKEVLKLNQLYSLPESIWMINSVTQDFLVRPMGIFQLTDYVGIDVCQYIMKVMNPYQENENLQSDLIDNLIVQGVFGGQNPDGSQKNGFFSYEKGRISGIWDPDLKKYLALGEIETNVKKNLGDPPDGHLHWREMIKDPEKNKKLEKFFKNLMSDNRLGSKLAAAFGKNSNSIGQLLVDKKVAGSSEDVNTVLLTGFFHAYGPVNEFFDSEQ